MRTMSVLNYYQITPVMPELTLAVLSMGLLIFGVFRGENSTRLLSWLSVLVLLAVGLVLTLTQDGRMVAFGGQFIVRRAIDSL